MKRFIVEVEDNIEEGDIKEYLYWGAREKKIWKSEPIEVKETWKRADGTPRMTTKQRDKLWELCGRYNVPFDESHYYILPGGMVEGWIGGRYGQSEFFGEKTIYVGVEPNGDSHS